MKLYYSPGACSLAVRILINEMGLNSEYESVDLKTKKTASGLDFKKINPKGVVPTLELDNKEILTENAVIQQYLADMYNATELLPPINDFKRYRVLEWQIYIATELHKGMSPLFHDKYSNEVKDNIIKPIIKTKLDYVNENLNGKNYLVGDHFTIADAYLFVMLTWLAHFKMDVNNWPNLQKYFENLKQRDSIKKSIQQENL